MLWKPNRSVQKVEEAKHPQRAQSDAGVPDEDVGGSAVDNCVGLDESRYAGREYQDVDQLLSSARGDERSDGSV